MENTNEYNEDDIVCVSGYFDPLHVGHIEYFKFSKRIGKKLLVIVNNDEQAVLKKGKYFMPLEERIKIIQELRCVDYVVPSIDTDRTVCKTIELLNPSPKYFCNGGDQNNNTIPEREVCEKLGIELRDGFGEKIQSSSWLVKGKK
jgi:cytidyltransferase-like protein